MKRRNIWLTQLRILYGIHKEDIEKGILTFLLLFLFLLGYFASSNLLYDSSIHSFKALMVCIISGFAGILVGSFFMNSVSK